MDSIIEKLKELVKEMGENEKITVSMAGIKPAYAKKDLEDLQNGLEVIYNDELLHFYSQVGEINLLWFVKKTVFDQVIPEKDLNYLSGSIRLLNPFDMIMGPGGNRWKDIFWFEKMQEEEKAKMKTFIPFDMPSTELIAGFKQEGKKISKEMYLFDNRDSISPFPMSFEQYLQYLLDTKGFFYWQEFYNDKQSEDYKRFVNYMPLLFDDFNPDFLTGV